MQPRGLAGGMDVILADWPEAMTVSALPLLLALNRPNCWLSKLVVSPLLRRLPTETIVSK
jgi:hypothetical protein